MNLKKIPSYVLIPLGVLLILAKPLSGITGLAIAENLDYIGEMWFYIVGAGMVVIGLLLGHSRKGLEDRVFAFGPGKRENAQTHLSEEEMGLSLKEFERFIGSKQYDTAYPVKWAEKYEKYHDSYVEDAREYDALRKDSGAKKRWLSERLQELFRDTKRLNEVKGIIRSQCPKIHISREAIKRAKDDSRVALNLSKYMDLIEQIAKSPEKYQTELIGEFNVSPRKDNPLRVAWSYDKKKNILNIYDLLYHVTDTDYVDNWNVRAGKREITRGNYHESGKAWNGDEKNLAA